MSEVAKLKEALELLYEPNPDDYGRNTTPVRWPLDVIGEAAQAHLDLLESDALVIRKVDGEWPAGVRVLLDRHVRDLVRASKRSGETLPLIPPNFFNDLLDALSDSLAKEGEG